MKRYIQIFVVLLGVVLFVPEFAAAQTEGGNAGAAGLIAIGVGLTMGLAVLGGGLAQGKAISSGLDAIGRNPGAQAKVLVSMLIGLALIESLVILGFVIANNLSGAVANALGVAS